jgi:hypothetical protein
MDQESVIIGTRRKKARDQAIHPLEEGWIARA